MMRLICISVAVIALSIVLCGGTFNGDYTSNHFDDGGVELLVPGMFCIVNNDTEKISLTNVTVDLAMYENDADFELIGTTTDIRYNSCVTYDYKKFVATPSERVPVCNLNYLGSDATTRLFTLVTTNIDASTADVTRACGSMRSGSILYMVIRCHREYESDSLGDAIYVTGCDVSNGIVVAEQATNFRPTDLDEQKILTRYTANMHLWKLDAVNAIPDVKKQTASGTLTDASGQSIPLGSSMFVEVCLAIDGPEVFFPENMAAPVGIYIKKCDVTYTYASGASYPTSNTIPLIINGCNNNGPPNFFNAAEDYVLSYQDDGNGATASDKLFSPNCQRTALFELKVAYRTFEGPKDVTITCHVGYCLTYEKKCFYPFDSLTKPTCSATGKRSAENDEGIGSMETVLNTTFRVSYESDRLIEEADLIYEVDESECFEKTTFFAVTSALGILLLIVFAIALFLFVKIRSGQKDDSSSMEGFKNKAYN